MPNETETVRAAALNLLHAMEQVFHSDWDYTKSELGIREGDPNAHAFIARLLGETDIPTPRPGPNTFLCPNQTIEELESNNWGNYVGLLEAYSKLRKVVGRASVCEQPQ